MKIRYLVVLLLCVLLTAIPSHQISHATANTTLLKAKKAWTAPKKPTLREIQQIKSEWYEFETTLGTFTLELNPDAAPLTCVNFKNLINKNFYQGVIFHRVIPDFIIQTGQYNANGEINVFYHFEDEINPLALGLEEKRIEELEDRGYRYDFNLPSMKIEQGTLSMANGGPDTNNTSIFILTKPDGADWLRGYQTTFGKVVKGLDVVLAIEKVKRNEEDKPLTDVTILSTKIIPKP